MPTIETKWILDCAKYFYNQYIDEAKLEGDNIYHSEKVKYLLFAFINASRCVTFYMQKEFSDAEGFLEWYKPEVLKLDTRWVELRNVTEKEHSPKIYEKVVFVFKLPPDYDLSGNNEKNVQLDSVQRFVTLQELSGPAKSIEDECTSYLSSLENLVNTCTEKFGDPHKFGKIKNKFNS